MSPPFQTIKVSVGVEARNSADWFNVPVEEALEIQVVQPILMDSYDCYDRVRSIASRLGRAEMSAGVDRSVSTFQVGLPS